MLRLDSAFGIARSLAVYYGQPWKARRRRNFYREFIQPGSLCFDVGAHVGNRISSWLALGARVVAFEPQPDLMQVLKLFYGANSQVSLRECAVGASRGRLQLQISSVTPTVSSLSSEWIADVQRDPRFAIVRWDRAVEVEVETLDDLIAQHGEPDFCKIDVEGFEQEVLSGLSRPLRALSFEYIPVAIERAVECVNRLQQLGPYEFRASPVETMRWAHSRGWAATRSSAGCGACRCKADRGMSTLACRAAVGVQSKTGRREGGKFWGLFPESAHALSNKKTFPPSRLPVLLF